MIVEAAPDALQPDRLPHDQQFLVAARRNDDHVSRSGGVNGRLNGLSGSQHWVGTLPPIVTVTVSIELLPFAAVISQFAALRRRAAVLRLLLMRAVRHTRDGTLLHGTGGEVRPRRNEGYSADRTFGMLHSAYAHATLRRRQTHNGG